MDMPDWLVPLIGIGGEFMPSEWKAATTVGVSVIQMWSGNNMARFQTYVDYRWKVLDQAKVSRAELESDYFKAAIIRIAREAAHAASDLKREALAQALISYVAEPTCQMSNKDLIIRVLSQLTDTEIVVMSCFVKDKDLLRWFNDENSDPWITDKELAERLKSPLANIRAVCEGLQQSGLLYDAHVGRLGYERGVWSLTELAQQLLEFAVLGEPRDQPA